MPSTMKAPPPVDDHSVQNNELSEDSGDEVRNFLFLCFLTIISC